MIILLTVAYVFFGIQLIQDIILLYMYIVIV